MIKKVFAAAAVCMCVTAAVYSRGRTEKRLYPPDKPFTIICPQPAGGGTDAIARALADAVNSQGEASAAVVNVSSGGTAAATDYYLSLPHDGYSVFIGGTHTICNTMQGLSRGYLGLTTVAGLNEDPFILAVWNTQPYMTLKELVTAAAQYPGTIVLGNAGLGGTTGVAGLGVNAALGKVFTVTGYDGSAGMIQAMKAGMCQAGIFSQSEIIEKRRQLRPLAILTDGHSTSPALADIPTLKEAGYDISIPGFSFRSVMIHKDAPEEMKVQLSRIIEKAYYSPSFQQFQKANALIQVFTKLEQADRFTADLIHELEPLMKDSGLYHMGE